jgi:hypothetical protein
MEVPGSKSAVRNARYLILDACLSELSRSLSELSRVVLEFLRISAQFFRTPSWIPRSLSAIKLRT